MESKRKTIFEQLKKPLPKEYVHGRKQHGIELQYIAGYIAIEQANRIFGYDGWGYTVSKYPELTKPADKQWHYHCAVKTWVKIDGKKVWREDVGFKDVVFTKKGAPMLEVAFKGCVTDALKRALRAWGDQFGNALYDKEEKIEKVKSDISTAEEMGLTKYVQDIMDCTTAEEVDEYTKSLNTVALDENWSKGQTKYIKGVADRVKRRIIKLEEAKEDEDKE